MDIAQNIGTPIRIDKATINGDFGHFTSDVDLANSLQYLSMIDCNGTLFDIDVINENLPQFCWLCNSICHGAASCHLA